MYIFTFYKYICSFSPEFLFEFLNGNMVNSQYFVVGHETVFLRALKQLSWHFAVQLIYQLSWHFAVQLIYQLSGHFAIH